MARQIKIAKILLFFYLSKPSERVCLIRRFRLSEIQAAKSRSVFWTFAFQATLYTTIFLSLFDLNHPMSIPTAIGTGVSFAAFQNVERFVRP